MLTNEQAASVLARLITHGFAAELPADLPPEWRMPYEAVRAVPASDYYQRSQAFSASLAEDPARFQMELEVEQAAASLENVAVDQLRVYSAWETLGPAPVQQTTIEGIFSRPSLNLLVGAPGAKKTWLALDLAVSVAMGKPWLGHPTRTSPSSDKPLNEPALSLTHAKQGEGVGGHQTSATPVLILDEEGGLQRTWDRLGRVLRGHNSPPKTPVYFIPPSGFDFAKQESAESLAGRARSLGAGLIIIDALINVMPGTDENNVLSVQPVLANLRRLAREANATVVVVHHTNKQGIFRGSTSLSSGVDHLLAVESEAQDDLISLTTIKARDVQPVSLKARCNFQSDSFSLSLAENLPNVKLGKPALALLSTLAELGSASSAQLATAGRTSTRLRGLIHELVSNGLIERSNPGSRGTTALYKLTKNGEKLMTPPPTKRTTT